jgi:PEGA domain
MRRRTATAMAIVAALAIIAVTSAPLLAQRRGGGHPRGPVFIGGYFYDPFFGPYPWWGPAAYAFPYYPVYDNRAAVRLLVTPKTASVYVDGYYAGVVDDFDGVMQSLPLSPGGHDITLFLEGYRTAHQKLFLTRDKAYKVHYALQPVAAGEQSEAPPAVPPVPPPPQGSAFLPRGMRGGGPPEMSAQTAGAAGVAASGFGTLALRVQPSDAEVLVDGEKWTPSQTGERLNVQVAAGVHRIAIQKTGYRPFAGEVTVQGGETTPVNVSLSSQ